MATPNESGPETGPIPPDEADASPTQSGYSEQPSPARGSGDGKSRAGGGGWIEDLALKSTGLPGLSGPPPTKETGEKTLWSYAGLGLQFAGTTAIFALMGYQLDRWTGWTPWGLISLSM